jgi:hypothetical protein
MSRDLDDAARGVLWPLMARPVVTAPAETPWRTPRSSCVVTTSAACP